MYCIANDADRVAATAARLVEVDAELDSWRRLAYNASQMRSGASFGRCDRAIRALEFEQDALRAAVK